MAAAKKQNVDLNSLNEEIKNLKTRLFELESQKSEIEEGKSDPTALDVMSTSEFKEFKSLVSVLVKGFKSSKKFNLTLELTSEYKMDECDEVNSDFNFTRFLTFKLVQCEDSNFAKLVNNHLLKYLNTGIYDEDYDTEIVLERTAKKWFDDEAKSKEVIEKLEALFYKIKKKHELSQNLFELGRHDCDLIYTVSASNSISAAKKVVSDWRKAYQGV